MYAQWIDKSSILLGDINFDGLIDVKDVSLVQKYIAGVYSFNDMQFYAADLNQDAKVNIKDVSALQNLIN